VLEGIEIGIEIPNLSKNGWDKIRIIRNPNYNSNVPTSCGLIVAYKVNLSIVFISS
jgi:hypothetical protein